jgi:hypothetical protein
MMRKVLTSALAALTLGGAIAATAAPADARPHGWGGGHYYGGGYRYYGHHGSGAGTAIAAGVAGLALGAALAGNSGHSYYRGGYYDRGYYGGGYYGYPAYGYYDDDYRVCESRHWVWDPYIGRRVLVANRYAC